MKQGFKRDGLGVPLARNIACDAGESPRPPPPHRPGLFRVLFQGRRAWLENGDGTAMDNRLAKWLTEPISARLSLSFLIYCS